jgi:two-component system sensor histidine kinase HydH
MAPPTFRRWPLYVLGTLCATITAVAISCAVGWYGHPVADVLVDPGGVVSNIGLPRREAKWTGLNFPDQVVSIDGRALTAGPGSPRARIWDEAIEDAYRAHRQTVSATVLTSRGARVFELHVRPLEPLWWWLYAGSMFFAGALYMGAGLIALWVNPGSPLARTFGKLGIASGLLLLLTFDFHTTRALPPLFFLAFAMVPMSWFTIALRLPDDAPVLRRFPWLERAIDGVGLLTAAGFLGLYYSGRETRVLQSAWSLIFAASFLCAAAALTLRFVLARGVRKQRLRALLLSVVSPHLASGLMIFPALRGNGGAIISFGTLSLFPLATAYAFLRYDLWGSRSLLSRILTRVAVGAIACALAIFLGTALGAQVGVPFGGALLSAGLGGALSTVLVLTALGAVDRRFFYSRMKYKPTVAQLSEELISIASPEEVARAVERTIRRWLPCELVELSLLNDARPEPGPTSGERPIDAPLDGEDEQLSLLVEFGGVRLGRLRVGAKAGSALFTQDDMDLLQTITNQGALALAHAYAYRELEAQRRDQAAAWRDERAALVETVAAEIAHEIRYPINFFRSVFSAANRPLDQEDVEIGREEVDRLERLVAGLRRLASHALDRKQVRVITLCERVETLLRDELAGRRLQLAVPVVAELHCDADQVTQVLVNLVANGLQAAGPTGTVGVAWSHGSSGAELVVWDSGPGFEGDSSRLFAPWYTTKPKGTGLGLAITHRLVRAHGWSITAQRRDNRTLFMIAIRADDVTRAGEPRDETKPSAEVA